MSEALFEALMRHLNALIEYRINKELGRSTEGYAHLLRSTDFDVREIIRSNDE